jgi:hypothetical protein
MQRIADLHCCSLGDFTSRSPITSAEPWNPRTHHNFPKYCFLNMSQNETCEMLLLEQLDSTLNDYLTRHWWLCHNIAVDYDRKLLLQVLDSRRLLCVYGFEKRRETSGYIIVYRSLTHHIVWSRPNLRYVMELLGIPGLHSFELRECNVELAGSVGPHC